jgi:hypothetical protein
VWASALDEHTPDGVGVRQALVHSAGPGMAGCSSLSGADCRMPRKHNVDRRDHIPKSFKLRNWLACEAGLRQRGSLDVSVAWFVARIDQQHGSASAVMGAVGVG